MLHLETYFIIAWAIQVFGCLSQSAELRPDRVKSGYEFEFNAYDILDVRVLLKNIPSGIENYSLNYRTECQKEDWHLEDNNCLESYKSIPTKGPVPEKRVLSFSLTLVEGLKAINYYIGLYHRNGDLCTNKKVVGGMRRSGKGRDTSYTKCLKAAKPCEVEVDFGNICDAIEIQQSYCNSPGNSLYVCENDNKVEKTMHQWHQVTNNGIEIGNIPPMYGMKSQFIIKLMHFDNNTDIFNEMEFNDRKFSTTKTKIKSRQLHSMITYEISNTIPYTELKEIDFDCSNYLKNTSNVKVCLLDPSGVSITTTDSYRLKKKFQKTDNLRMLCCLYYLTYNNETVKKVRRFVENINLLKYINGTAGLDDPSRLDEDEKDQPVGIYYIVGTAVGSIILIIIISMTIKWFCCSKRNSENSMAMHTYTNTNMVLYADLDIRPGENRQVNTTEESPYAEIIGVLKPPR